MKLSRFFLSVAAGCGLLGYQAEVSFAQGYYQSGSHRGVAYNYYQDEAASPSDRPAVQQTGRGRKATQNPRKLVPQKAGGKGLQWDFLDQFCHAPCEPWTLFANDNASRITINGHTQIGYHTEGTNGDGTPGSFNDYPNRFQLQQQWLKIQRAAHGGKGFDWGFGMDYVYGTDAPDMQSNQNAAGEWDRDWENGGAYGHAIPQLYAEVAYAGMRVKGGHFFGPLGYEKMAATENFFYSRSYGRGLDGWFIPRTVTGVLADWSVGNHVTAHAGWIDGYDTGFGSFDAGSMFLGGVSMMVFDTMHLSYSLVTGDDGTNDNVYAHNMVVRWQLSDRLESAFETMLYTYDGSGQSSDDSSITLTNYMFYALNDCMKLGLRSEWVDLGRDYEEFNAVTVGLNYQATSNLLLRPELRLDNFHRDINDGLNDGGVFSAGRRDSTVFGLDMILTY